MSAAIVALLADLINRGHIEIASPDVVTYGGWRLKRGPGPRGPGMTLARYERELLGRLYPRGDESLGHWSFWHAHRQLYRTSRKLLKKSRRLRRNPQVRDAVRDFAAYLTDARPAELDPQVRRDCLPYLISLASRESWSGWGVRSFGSRKAPGDTGDDWLLPVIACTLYDRISANFYRHKQGDCFCYEYPEDAREASNARIPL